ncbi:tRNA lysidine(34) synthetase TilS [soil metagenome]
MLESFLNFINKNNLFSREDNILLAISGGIDSVAMAHLFQEAGFNFAIAHCNFNLRGEESDADELFVRKLAKKLKVNIHVKQFDTLSFAEQEIISTQMAARNLRFKWFHQLIQEYGYSKVATAHHKNDSLETILLNLVRGTGIAGLHGILPSSGEIIRPLLFADKEIIYDLVAEKHLTWREDSSNESIKYKRNLIRHEVIPVLKQINPNLEETIETTIEKIRAVELVFQNYIKNIEQQVLINYGSEIYIDILVLKNQEEPKIILSTLLEKFNYSYHQSEEIYQKMENGTGKVFDSTTHRLNIDREKLYITEKNLSKFESEEIPVNAESFSKDEIKLNFSVIPIADFKMNSDPSIAFLDFDQLNFPLIVRKWKPGDWFCPLGMNKKKKLSDFMIDEKIPLNLKQKAYVLVSDDSIAWIIGRRIDNRFKITDKTVKVLKVVYSAVDDKSL